MVPISLFFGAALGNVLRGVAFDANSNFFLPLWTNLLPGPDPGILDWFTITIGVASVAALAMHGALWVATRSDGALQARTRSLAGTAWLVVVVLSGILLLILPVLLPHFGRRYAARPWGLAFPILAVASLVGIGVSSRRARDSAAFLYSCIYIVSMLAAAAFGHYPYLLPEISNDAGGLTIFNASTSVEGLSIALYWFIPGMMLVTSYFVFAYRNVLARTGSGQH
jgi:cytochrome d ubiquinol oxidase subunit II